MIKVLNHLYIFIFSFPLFLLHEPRVFTRGFCIVGMPRQAIRARCVCIRYRPTPALRLAKSRASPGCSLAWRLRAHRYRSLVAERYFFYLRRVAADSSCMVRQQSLLPIPARYRYLFIIGRFYLRAVRRKAFSLGRRGTAAKRWWMWGTVFPTSVICSCFANASFSPGRSLVCRVSSPLGHPERSILGCVAEGSALPLSLLFYHKTRRGARNNAIYLRFRRLDDIGLDLHFFSVLTRRKNNCSRQCLHWRLHVLLTATIMDFCPQP